MTVKGHAACTAVEPARAGSGGGKYIGIAVWCANQLATKFSLNVTFISKSISSLIGNYNSKYFILCVNTIILINIDIYSTVNTKT